jgi:hypothetical protein
MVPNRLGVDKASLTRYMYFISKQQAHKRDCCKRYKDSFTPTPLKKYTDELQYTDGFTRNCV